MQTKIVAREGAPLVPLPRIECAQAVHSWRFEGRAELSRHPLCDDPNLLRCRGCYQSLVVRCGTTRRRRCPPCAESHRRRVREVIQSGFIVGGRGEAVFLTLTAPGEHQHIDSRTGSICPCTPDGGIVLGQWNAELPKRWNRFCQQLKRRLGFEVEYVRAIEVQKRGALHEHLLIIPRSKHHRITLRVESLRELAMEFGYGHSVRLEPVSSVSGASSYVSKYISKACDERAEVPWIDLETGELMQARYRPWSASRHWGITMRAVKQAQRAWAMSRAAQPPGDESATVGAPGKELGEGEHALGRAGPARDEGT